MSAEPAQDDRQADALDGMLERTVIQHRSSSIPGRDIGQVRPTIPAGAASGWR